MIGSGPLQPPKSCFPGSSKEWDIMVHAHVWVGGGTYKEACRDTQTSIRLASHLVRATNSIVQTFIYDTKSFSNTLGKFKLPQSKQYVQSPTRRVNKTWIFFTARSTPRSKRYTETQFSVASD
jgi:hypothetical protein